MEGGSVINVGESGGPVNVSLAVKTLPKIRMKVRRLCHAEELEFEVSGSMG